MTIRLKATQVVPSEAGSVTLVSNLSINIPPLSVSLSTGRPDALVTCRFLTPNGLLVHVGQALVLDTGGGKSRGHGFLQAPED